MLTEREQALKWLAGCACATCREAHDDVLEYVERNNYGQPDDKLYGRPGGATALVLDAHVYAQTLRHVLHA